MMKKVTDTILSINKRFENEFWLDFEVECIKNNVLVLRASRDFSYYHLMELKFLDVLYFQGPFSWGTSPNNGGFIRIFNENELLSVVDNYGIDRPFFMVEISMDNGAKIVVGATDIESDFDTVYYYQRENLGEGERIILKS